MRFFSLFITKTLDNSFFLSILSFVTIKRQQVFENFFNS